MLSNMSDKEYEIFIFNNNLKLNNIRYKRFCNFLDVNLELLKFISIFDSNKDLKKILYSEFKKNGYGPGYLNSTVLNEKIFKDKVSFNHKYFKLNPYVVGCEVGYDLTYNKSSVFFNFKMMYNYFIFNGETYYFSSLSEKENLLKTVFLNKENHLRVINFLEICFSYSKNLRRKDLDLLHYKSIVKSYFKVLSDMNYVIKSSFIKN